MKRGILLLPVLAVVLLASPAMAAISGVYVEARTCDVWTGPCFANAEMGLSGKHAVMGWKVEKGEFDNVALDGLGVVAVIAARDTLGLPQSGAARSVLIVDSKATPQQRDALVKLAKAQGGKLLTNVLSIQTAPVNIEICDCPGNACARLNVKDLAQIETRCIHDKHDKVCGNEEAFYPALSKNVKVKAAMAVKHSYQGKEFKETWLDHERRGAYIGSFEVR
ncbi:MAG: DUF1326 domain-containing protein [Gemmataceae bacterium]